VFIKQVLKEISKVNPHCIYLLWGREAQKIKPLIGNKSIILEAAHPSGLSARRGFFGCNHFNLINEHLIKLNQPIINWSLTNN
jgi:uracil-DNA glycosylase